MWSKLEVLLIQFLQDYAAPEKATGKLAISGKKADRFSHDILIVVNEFDDAGLESQESLGNH